MEEKTFKFQVKDTKTTKRKIRNNPHEAINNRQINNTINQEEYENKKNLYKIIIFSIIGILLVGVIIALVIVFTRKPKKNNNITNIPNPDDPDDNQSLNNNSNGGKDPEYPISPQQPVGPEKKVENPHIETEFEFNTTTHDLRRVFVEQKYTEDIITFGQKINNFYDRKTNYDIYIISEEEPDEENKNFYNKKFTASISISSQCISSKDENCEPQRMIDFSKVTKKNIRSLEEMKDFKDIPIPLCLFNITDNDVITSMTCPETLQISIKQNMILDLYFFRPPAIKRPDKEKGNITITKWIENNKHIIRETNGGICDIPDSFNSFCTTDMNTTTDQKGNLLQYDEIAFTNITKDENNSYVKNKITKLVDLTDSLPHIDTEIFEESLNKILSKLEKYMIFQEEFSTENFKELYKVSKNISEDDTDLRVLISEKGDKQISKEENIFNFDHFGGVKLLLNLFDDIGYHTESMKAFSNIKINDGIKEISTLKEFTNIGDILDQLKTLSESGNSLATQLLNSIKFNFDIITQIIKNNITLLNSLINYKDLSEIFDSTSSIDSLKNLPISIIQEASNLKIKLSKIFDKIDNGGMKNNINILNEDIYSYIRNSHIIVNKIFTNLRNLGKSLDSPKSKLTEISTYYLKNTPKSYTNTIEEAKNLLLNYYKEEKNLIVPKVESLLKLFEEATKESINKEEKIVDNLYNKLENQSINIQNANNDDYRQINLDLYNSINYINEIIEKAKEKIKNEMDLKDSGYFISNYDINLNNNSFTQVINDAYEIAIKLDNDEYIDKTFDQTMTYFRENYTYIIKYMNKLKEEEFPLNEDVLQNSLFSTPEQESIFNSIINMGIKTVDEIIDENNKYLNSIKNEVNTFLDENKNELNELILNLTILFSEESLKNLSDLYDIAFQSCLNKINDDIETNKILSQNYFNEIGNIVKDNNKIIDLLKTFKTDEKNLPYILIYWNRWHYVYLKNFIDSISSKTKTQGYLNKYNKFKAIMESSKQYINEQLYIDLKYEYKNALTKLRENLQIIKNSKISDEYPDFPELNFIDNDLKKIDNLYDRLNKYLSDDIFNQKYLSNLNTHIKNKLSDIDNINNNIIDNNHKIINTPSTANDFNNDFCITFLRKKTYTCTNGAIYNYQNSDYYCLPLSSNSNNHDKLIKLSIDSDENMNKFINGLNEFMSKLQYIVITYSSKIDNFKNKLLSLENQISENEAVNTYLNKFDSKIKSLLSDKFEDELIKNSYNYYQTNIEERLTNIFEDISNKWVDIFDELKEEINKNLDKYKNSITEFGIMALLYEKMFTKNISKTYFNSINLHQRNEFNYTISYYYNYLLKVVNSSHQYIISKIPTNKYGFNNILNKRTDEVNELFINLKYGILKSKYYAMNLENQLYVLQVPVTNFFDVNDILTNTQTSVSEKLKTRASAVYTLINNKINDEFSLSARFYLENSENGKQINEFYEPINNKIFISLNLEKFKELIIKNWIFDQDNFIKQLNTTLYNTNLETNKELSIKLEEYESILEAQITKYFTKETIVEKINNLYENAIKETEENNINEINNNINEIINKIKYHLLEEAKRLNNTSTSYWNDFTKINNTIEEYKKNLFKNINETIFNVIDGFYNNMFINVYNNYIENYLDKYLKKTRNITSNYEKSNLLNSSFDIGEIISDKVQELVNEYKIITKKQIYNKYNYYYNNLAIKIKIDEIKNIIYNEIDQEYSNLFNSLKVHAKYNPGDMGYTSYDLSDDIKEDINVTMKSKLGNIKISINSTIGSNYEVNIRSWTIPDYSLIKGTLDDINESFDKFIRTQKNNEINNVNNCLQKIIKYNFNDLLNNLIPSFGNEFFDRIISYNENFKIETLYDNLRWGLSQTLTYYISLHSFSKIKALTKDLKIRLYSLNNLDTTIEQKNKQILESLDLEVNQFIQESKNHIIQKYINFIKNDTSIELAFNKDIRAKIDENLNKIITEIEYDYIELLNKYLKEKLISSYTNVLNQKTEEMIKTVHTQRELIKARIDDLFSLNPDEVLNDINNQINYTLTSINEYKEHFNAFKISDEIISYLNTYGKNIILPSYEQLKTLLNKVTKDKIFENLEKKFKNL